MIPLRDKNPTQLVPFINVALIVANVAVFLYQVTSGEGVGLIFQRFAVIPADLSAMYTQGHIQILTVGKLFTSMFLHGGWLHLGGNMLYLWVFGDNIEDKLGHTRYFLFYVICGVISTVAHVLIEPQTTIPMVGASGAISGVLGAYLVLFPKARVLTVIPIFVFLQFAELPAIVVLGLWFVLQFFNGLASIGFQTAGAGGVAWWAHVGGFIAGIILILPMRKYR
jgi:membrane associated rhomboid family serine protease